MSRYIYTHHQSKFSKAQRDFYEQNGYILIKNNVSHKLLDEMRDRFLDICNRKVDIGMIKVMKDLSLDKKGAKGEHLINKIQNFAYDDILWKYCCHESVVDIVENIIGPNITAVHSMIINKPPDADPEGSSHSLHQDMHYFPFRPATNIVAAWTAMERVDEHNGCLYVVPGSHTGQLYKHEYSQGDQKYLYHGIHGVEVVKVYVPMEKGDTIFFHPLLMHGSGPNFTKGFRKAISCHYADSNCTFIDIKGTIQEPVCREIEALFVKKGLMPSANIAEIWKTKSRLVRGRPGNFQTFSSNL